MQTVPAAPVAPQPSPRRSPWRRPAPPPLCRAPHHTGTAVSLAPLQAALAASSSSRWRSWRSAGTGCERSSGGRTARARRTAFWRNPKSERRSPRFVCSRGPGSVSLDAPQQGDRSHLRSSANQRLTSPHRKGPETDRNTSLILNLNGAVCNFYLNQKYFFFFFTYLFICHHAVTEYYETDYLW